MDDRVDIVIAGGGACGMVAALAARQAGADIVVLEQDDTPRGSTAMSQGLICAAGTQAQRAAGVDDDDGTVFLADILKKTRGQTDASLARTIANSAGNCLDWLQRQYGLPFVLDTRFRAAYGHSRQRVHGWPGHGGADLIQFLHQAAEDRGIAVATRARLADLDATPDGSVSHVVIARPGGERERLACKTLILATSGFAANANMVGHYMPELNGMLHHGHAGNRGAGIELGARLGGALADMGAYQGYAMLVEKWGISLPPGHIMEGGILVSDMGNRFCNEMADIAGMVHAVQAQEGHMAWAIYDEAIEAACAHIPETRDLMDLRAAKCAATIDELAALIAVPVHSLAGALHDAHAALARGAPDAMGRNWYRVAPPASPYRAIPVRGALYHTQGGLQIDGEARVLRPDGSHLPNLFAGGGAARGVSGPSSWGYLPAMGLCAAVTLGRIAGMAAARQARAGH